MRETATGSPIDVGSESTEDHVSGRASGADEPHGPPESVSAGQPDGPDGEVSPTGAGAFDVGATHADGFDAGADTDDSTAGHPVTAPATFRRPPGMVPPPDRLDGDSDAFGRSAQSTSTAEADTGSYPSIGSLPQVSDLGHGAVVPAPDASRMRMVDTAAASAAIGSARVHEAVRATRMPSGPRGPRRARLSVKRLDPWSVMKFSFAVSLVLFIVVLVATSVLYLALDTMGVFASVNNTLADLVESGGADGEGFRVTASGVIGGAGVLGAVNVVLFTALATLGAFIYNVCADLVGGVEVTLAERE